MRTNNQNYAWPEEMDSYLDMNPNYKNSIYSRRTYDFGRLAENAIRSEEGIWYSVDRSGNIRIHTYYTAGIAS